ncbi:MAG: hypothetical protein OXH39_13770 [Candidatus Poribacteria bacterium]|nr:hypothetical protein [Candidatus Poribacteria bacterium]
MQRRDIDLNVAKRLFSISQSEYMLRADDCQMAVQFSNMPQTIEESASLNRKNMNRNQILRAVAQKCIKQYPSLHEAAESSNMDIRTLQKYAQWRRN